jgi:D-proline reductase (dithiol) PrdB
LVAKIDLQSEMTVMPDGATIRQRIYHLIGRLYSRVPMLARRWGRGFDALAFDDVPFMPLHKPLDQCRLALITTGGVHLQSQPPYDMADPRGDPSYRVIPADTPPAQLTITHDYYDHTDAERDLNILLPIRLLRELAEGRQIGSLATCYSFMGHIEPPHVESLLKVTAPQVAGKLKQERVDAVLLTPA